MNINLTLLGQMITFAIFVWFTVRFVWPPITKALTDRQKKIAEGLAASERAVHELEVARHQVTDILRNARADAATILEGAQHRAIQVMEDAKEQARLEGERLIRFAQKEIDRAKIDAKRELQHQVANLAVQGAEQLLRRHIDPTADKDLLKQLAEQLS